MVFSVPTFNVAVNVYTGPWLTKVYRATLTGNFSFGRRVQQQALEFFGGPDNPGTFQHLLLLPARSDVRSKTVAPVADVIEIPALSGMWYQISAVGDVARDFPNEYRVACVVQICQAINPVDYSGCIWPVPMP